MKTPIRRDNDKSEKPRVRPAHQLPPKVDHPMHRSGREKPPRQPGQLDIGRPPESSIQQ